MIKIIKLLFVTIILYTAINAKDLNTGEEVFKAYCWGCHHQTAVAFGPSFEYMANNRSKIQIITHISSPQSDYKSLGYKRSVMPSFGTTLTKKELYLITDFIISYKDTK